MVLLSKVSEIIAGKSSASTVYQDTANMQTGFMTDLDFTPNHHMDHLRSLRRTVSKSHDISGDELIRMKGENSALARISQNQAAYFQMVEERANNHVNMVKQETSHQVKLLGISSKLSQVQRSAIDSVANLSQSNAMSYAPYAANMSVMSRGGKGAGYSVI